jgi:hypothetical protein
MLRGINPDEIKHDHEIFVMPVLPAKVDHVFLYLVAGVIAA